MSTAKRKSILVSFYKSIVGTLFPSQEPSTSTQGTMYEQLLIKPRSCSLKINWFLKPLPKS